MKNLLLLLVFLLSFSISAQHNPGKTQNQFSVSFLLPGLEYETVLSDKTTIDFRVGTGFTFAMGKSIGTQFGIYPNFHTQYRYYYNFEKRADKGKNTSNNSGNYFALNGGLYGGKPLIGEIEYNMNYGAEIGPVWGIQRVYKSGFKLDLHLGLGYSFNDLGNSGFSSLISFRLGWLLFN
ncbi:hypothetical protein [Salinimicrobium marinum]|uniref:hypothetical protein n=1 Tax=Salinimicrobium marinum TaxID=680283 RepID=UPI00167C2D63|nr:hypothetical protein [Salinimicrobium marinum]